MYALRAMVIKPPTLQIVSTHMCILLTLTRVRMFNLKTVASRTLQSQPMTVVPYTTGKLFSFSTTLLTPTVIPVVLSLSPMFACNGI